MRLDTRRATSLPRRPAARNDHQPGRTNSRSSPLVISLAVGPPCHAVWALPRPATTAVNTNTTAGARQRRSTPFSGLPRRIPSITNPDDCRATYHCPRPGGLHDLPKPDSATEKKALALVSGGKETRNPRSCRSRLSPLSFPNPLPFPSAVKQLQQQTRETIPSSRWRCTRIANIDALCPRSLPCDGRAARQSRMESAVLGLERESISSPLQRGSLQGEGDGRGRR